MHHEQRQRTTALLKARALDRALFSHPQSVTYLTGFAPALGVVPSPFLGHAAFVWYEMSHYTLLFQEGQEGRASAGADLDLLPYSSYTLNAPIQIPKHQQAALKRLVRPGYGAIGIEEETLPLHLWRVLEPHTDTFTTTDGLLEPLRMVKTEEELIALREAFRLTDVGFRIAEEHIQSGAREIDIWTAVQGGVEREVGARVALGNDCVVGSRQNNIGGWPEDYALTEGDSLIIDLSVSQGGYWSDGCRTFFAGETSRRQREVYGVVRDALEYGASLLEPGVEANKVDRELRRFIEERGHPAYPHHSGHSVGVHTHENPRITPYDETRLEAGMVVMLEPGVYYPGEFGVRLEDGFLVTESGVQPLTEAPRNY